MYRAILSFLQDFEPIECSWHPAVNFVLPLWTPKWLLLGWVYQSDWDSCTVHLRWTFICISVLSPRTNRLFSGASFTLVHGCKERSCFHCGALGLGLSSFCSCVRFQRQGFQCLVDQAPGNWYSVITWVFKGALVTPHHAESCHQWNKSKPWGYAV